MDMKKIVKATIAKNNSINALSGMHNYVQDGRTYQSEKYSGPLNKRTTRILSPEEKKRKIDLETTSQNIRYVLCRLSEKEGKEFPTKEIEKTYKLKPVEGYVMPRGDSAEVFQILCERYPQAKFYKGWSDIFNSLRNGNSVRTEPMKTIKFKCDEHFAIDDCKPIYKAGDTVYCLVNEDGRFNVYKVNVVSYYIKELSGGKFDIMYELSTPCFGNRRVWKLQGNGTVFSNAEEAIAGAKVKNHED